MAMVRQVGIWRSASFSAPSAVSGRTESVGGGHMFWLPEPVKSFPLITETKGKLEEPIAKEGGNKVYNNELKTSVVTITGEFGRQIISGSQAAFGDTGAMFECYRDLREFCSTTPGTEYQLFAYYDSGSSTYRKWKKVYFNSLTTDIGDLKSNLLSWTLQLWLLDPTIYTTAPGS